MKEHFKLLGLPVLDAVTGFTGVVTSISFDLYGCVTALVTPKKPKEGDSQDSRWFDTKRLKSTSSKPVLPVPTFAFVPGGQSKPVHQSQPLP